ncbi:MAG: pyridoxamine 5'-phosphate oxidase family protein [Proteobacteria bacterium]|nr:pyridoxamine 5'-phosphate oxidase family protein [Pseudomonadota bacterium]MBU6425763.1 pyridoxamine 5'-phosphate oxidase family protein [Rhodospirillales bacterium]
MDDAGTRWHAGEAALHERLGITTRMEGLGQRVIRRYMPEQHRSFFAQLPFILIGVQDASGNLWASMLSGESGFVSSPSPTSLRIQALPISGDPLAEALTPGHGIGTLGIELPTRRRNRANGRIIEIGSSGFTLAVEESFGNCPKYIVRRDYLPEAPASRPAEAFVQEIAGLDEESRKLIGQASIFFVASTGDALPDVSHRGGVPGFVELAGDTLVIPDYLGNLFFNTLGNLLLNPRAGLLFPDFETGDLLQLSGTTTLQGANPGAPFVPGEGSFWRFHPTAGRWHRNALKTSFGSGEISSFAPKTRL